MRHSRKRSKGALKRCSITHLVIINDELEAKMVLARRMRNDRGEKRYFPCGNHFHLTSLEEVQ